MTLSKPLSHTHIVNCDMKKMLKSKFQVVSSSPASENSLAVSFTMLSMAPTSSSMTSRPWGSCPCGKETPGFGQQQLFALPLQLLKVALVNNKSVGLCSFSRQVKNVGHWLRLLEFLPFVSESTVCHPSDNLSPENGCAVNTLALLCCSVLALFLALVRPDEVPFRPMHARSFVLPGKTLPRKSRFRPALRVVRLLLSSNLIMF